MSPSVMRTVLIFTTVVVCTVLFAYLAAQSFRSPLKAEGFYTGLEGMVTEPEAVAEAKVKPEFRKVFWTYWNDPDVPDFIQRCTETWKRHNPDYEVVMLKPDTLSKYLSPDAMPIMMHKDNPARIADYVRLAILAHNGGIWVDASSIMYQPITWLQEIKANSDCDLFAFYTEAMQTKPEFPVLESWFIAADAGTPFIKAWDAEFKRLDTFETIDAYIDDVRSQGIDFQRIDVPGYHTIHLAAQVVMQKNPELLQKVSSESAEKGPLYYLINKGLGHSTEALQEFCGDDAADVKKPLVKFTSHQRNHLKEKPEIASCLFAPVE